MRDAMEYIRARRFAVARKSLLRRKFVYLLHIARQSCEHMHSEVGMMRQGKLKPHDTTVQS